MDDEQRAWKSFMSLEPLIFATGLCHRPIWLSYYALHAARPFDSLHTIENRDPACSVSLKCLFQNHHQYLVLSPLRLSLNLFSSVTRRPTSLENSKSQNRTDREDWGRGHRLVKRSSSKQEDLSLIP